MPLNFQDVGVVVLAASVFLFLKRKNKEKYALPPSPKGRLPLLGHALQMPTSHGWFAFERWGKELNSDIIYLDAAGMGIIVINSYQMVKDLFDSRSAIYSGRSSFTMVNELMGYDWTMPTLPYNSKWKSQRRLFSKYFSASNTSAYHPRVREFTHLMLPKLLNTPEDFITHIKHMVGAAVISMAYGMPIRAKNDPNIKIAQDSLDQVLEAFIPGRYLVDTIPWMKYLPKWLPGTGFFEDARRGRETMNRLLDMPFSDAERHIANGTARPSLVSMALEEIRDMEDPKEIQDAILELKEVASVFFGAGYDTTHATITNFILAMTLFPEVQAKARQELDSVVGSDRLPDLSDEEKLPYLRAVLKEVVRWRPVSAIGLPHLSTEDDVYNGYYIPKNTLIIPNQRGMLFDPKIYPDPETFSPERFLSPDGLSHNQEVRDPQTIAFGFGRRMCPGFHIALSQLFLSAACILATFEISKAKDEQGNVIEPPLDVAPGITSHSLPFKCVIKPRSQKTKELIQSAAADYEA
ncbi:cytochrome P450 [Ephemerocybe angulata]|uniref:Cytochrome P450 n=1 Tax=Ephemerocybe angulata TaxID=980116 RepID=A0A8H6ICH8_9AGAR|nr:cytochrome P450 [Tulosesus angulatus]